MKPSGKGFPESFPLAQFPNPPLWVALAGLVGGWLTSGTAHSVCRSLFYLGLTVWAYLELVDGVNWFRRLLGAGFLVYLVVSLTLQLPG